MQQPPSAPSRTPSRDPGLGANFAVVLMSLAYTLESYLHNSFGVRYISYKGPFGAALIAASLLVFPHDNRLPLVCFGGVYIVFWLAHQLNAWRRRWNNRIDDYTFYTGRPYLHRLMPFMDERFIKRIEPLLTATLAYCVYHHNRPLGFYLWVSSLALLFTSTVTLTVERKRALDLHDAVARQRRTADDFRAIRN